MAGSGSGAGPEHAAIAATAIKNAPVGGYPSGRIGPQICGVLIPVLDATNQPSSVSNAAFGAQMNLAANSLDPVNRRVGHQVSLSDAVQLASGGVPVEWSSAVSVSTSADSWFKWHVAAAGNYSIAVLDTRLASGANSKVLTSLVAPSATIAVDPVVPFASAGLNGQPVSATNTAQVQVGSNTYTLVGVSLDGAAKTSGRLTFTSPVTIADATAGNRVLGASRTVWLGSGQQLALDTTGTANLFYDTALAAIHTTAPVQVTGALGVTGTVNAGASVTVNGSLTVQGGATISGGTVLLPSYQVAALPTASAGALAYATNGRKPSENQGAGSGVLVWGTAAKQWLSILSGTPVQA